MVTEEVISIWIGLRLIKMVYRQHTDGYRTLIALDEPPVETRSPENEPQPQGVERRGRLDGWNFPEWRKA